MKRAVVEVGQPCRHCGTAVIHREHEFGWTPRDNQQFWFDWWLVCPKCSAIYLVEAAKQFRNR